MLNRRYSRRPQVKENFRILRRRKRNRLGEGFRRNSPRRLNERYNSIRYRDSFWDELDRGYFSTLDHEEMFRFFLEEHPDENPADYPEDSAAYWRLIEDLISDEIDAQIMVIREYGMDEIAEYLRSKGYDGFSSGDIEVEDDGDESCFCWDEKALKRWVAHEFLTRAGDFLMKNGFTREDVNFFEQRFLEEYCASSSFRSSYPMDERDMAIVFYDDEIGDRLSDPMILKGLEKAHRDAYKFVFDSANECMRILKDNYGLRS